MRPGNRSQSGFTLIELMIVLAIIGILATLAQPSYERYVIRARETALRQQLVEVRGALDQFRADRGLYPDSMEELVSRGYLPRAPSDPFTRGTTWILMPPPAGERGRIGDLHSASDLVSLDGTPYNEW